MTRIPRLALIILAVVGLAPAPAGAADPIKVGFSAPLTSPIAFIAERAKFGTEYAVAELNAKGGILGRPVEVSYGDTRLDLATTNIGDNSVTVYLGNGDGTFLAASQSPLGTDTTPTGVVIADFTGQGTGGIAVIELVILGERRALKQLQATRPGRWWLVGSPVSQQSASVI